MVETPEQTRTVAASDEQEVGAMNVFASIFGGNVEVAAGFAVGLLRGVWESTGGTIVFLVQAVASLVMLPVRLVQWATGLDDGTTEEDGVTPAEGTAPLRATRHHVDYLGSGDVMVVLAVW